MLNADLARESVLLPLGAYSEQSKNVGPHNTPYTSVDSSVTHHAQRAGRAYMCINW